MEHILRLFSPRVFTDEKLEPNYCGQQAKNSQEN